jgi:glycosyltransferase involved in cell wall biosynthesis
MSTTKVCYLLPAYNNGPYLNEALESVVADAEASGLCPNSAKIIALNDGSTDLTREVLKRALREIHFPLEVLNNRSPSGEGGARRTLFVAGHRTEAELYRLCDGDDILIPGSTAILTELLLRDSLVAAGGSVQYFGDPWCQLKRFEDNLDDHEIRSNVRKSWVMCIAAGLINGATVRENNFLPRPIPFTADCDIIYELLKMGRLGNTLDTIYKYRQHPESIMAKHRQQVAKYAATTSIRHLLDISSLGLPDLADISGILNSLSVWVLPPNRPKQLHSLKDKIISREKTIPSEITKFNSQQ